MEATCKNEIVKVRFVPQVASGREILRARGPEGQEEAVFLTATAEVKDLTGSTNPEPDDYPSDSLRECVNAPEWVKNWEGPFFCELVESWSPGLGKE